MRYRIATLPEHGMYSEVETDRTSKKAALAERKAQIKLAFNKEVVICYKVDGKDYDDIAQPIQIRKKTDARYGEHPESDTIHRKKFLKYRFLNKLVI